MAVQMAPSILSADFARLADEAAAVTGVADWLHVDVMDGHFPPMPNLTLGLPVVEALLKHAGLPLDCHLMITEPDRWAPAYAEAWRAERHHPRRGGHLTGAHPPDDQIRRVPKSSLAVNPATPVEPYADMLPELDMLLLMTIEPGFGGQPFLDLVLPKLRRARDLVTRHGDRSGSCRVDGGSEREDHRALRGGGCGRLRGLSSAVYGADDPAAAVPGPARPGRAGHRATHPWSC